MADEEKRSLCIINANFVGNTDRHLKGYEHDIIALENTLRQCNFEVIERLRTTFLRPVSTFRYVTRHQFPCVTSFHNV